MSSRSQSHSRSRSTTTTGTNRRTSRGTPSTKTTLNEGPTQRYQYQSSDSEEEDELLRTYAGHSVFAPKKDNPTLVTPDGTLPDDDDERRHPPCPLGEESVKPQQQQLPWTQEEIEAKGKKKDILGLIYSSFFLVVVV